MKLIFSLFKTQKFWYYYFLLSLLYSVNEPLRHAIKIKELICCHSHITHFVLEHFSSDALIEVNWKFHSSFLAAVRTVLSWLCFPSCFCECLQQIGNGCYQRVSRIIHHPWTFLHIHLQGEPQDKEMFINLKYLTFLFQILCHMCSIVKVQVYARE